MTGSVITVPTNPILGIRKIAKRIFRDSSIILAVTGYIFSPIAWRHPLIHRSIKESQRMFRSGINGKLSSNPLRHLKYLFVASTTLACRAAIEGGIEAQQAYNLSDLFIQRADACETVEEVFALQTDMIRSFTEAVQEVQDNPLQYQNYSPEIEQVIEYIYLHLHEKILIPQLADIAHMSPQLPQQAVQETDRKDNRGIHFNEKNRSSPKHAAPH